MSDLGLRDLENRLHLPGLAACLGAGLSRSADPARALRLGRDLLAAAAEADAPRLADVWARWPGEVTRVLAALGGAAPFLVPFFTRLPALLLDLFEQDFATPRTRAELKTRLTAWVDAVPAADIGTALRRFKYAELARITVRDLSEDLVPESKAGETLAELTYLADALLGQALASTATRLAETHGAPRWLGPNGQDVGLSFCVLGVGKLGSEELNYSSDVDLLYVFEHPPEGVEEAGQGGARLTPVEYFTRLAQEFGRLVGESTREGFLYRVDLDLRPEGGSGPLVVSSEMLTEYYELWAATWEKAAFAKARPVAGDEALGWRVIRAIDPMIYRSAMDFAAVAAIKALKERIEQAKERTGGTFNVKLSAGGIRDVEFVVQALQLLHGGRIPEVRERSTERALVALAQVGILPPEESADLLAAYRFLRRTENRLQMEAERQTHRLPKEPEALERLARAMGFLDSDAVAKFEDALDTHRRRVREIFAALFHEEGGSQILALFERNVPDLFANSTTRRLVESLAGQFARAIANTADPERALNNLDRFIHGVGPRTFYYGLLLDRPELVPRLSALFAASEYLSGYFARHPRLIEPIFSDPNVLLLTRQELLADLAKIRRVLAREGRGEGAELELDALRLFHHRELLNVGLLDLIDKVTLAEAERALTEIAEVCVEQGLALAQAEMRKRGAPLPHAAQVGEFLVVGMGKLASRELTYGSDLDVIFLYDVPRATDSEMIEAQEYFVRLAQKLIWTLQTFTNEGLCYAIDARLRPSGSQGMLVTSLASFERYHATSAQVWERQALLRARPVAGSERLAQAFEALRLQILRRPVPSNLGQEVHRIRLRMESELGHETPRRHDFKTGRGGLLDIESVVQFLQLRHGAAHAELFAVDRTDTQLSRLERLGLLTAEDSQTLRSGWAFLERLASRLRIVENRSISDLDEERGDLDALARRLGYSSPQRAGGARRGLLDDYRRHTGAIRGVYLRVLGVG